MDNDALKNYKAEEGTGGLFLKFKADTPVKLRVLTLNPIVSIDKFGNTRYNYVVWNHDEARPQILSKGTSIHREIVGIHMDEDFGSIQDTDIKITSTGEGMETRYEVRALPTAIELTPSQIKEASDIKLDEKVQGVRLSEYNQGKRPTADGETPGYDKARAVAQQLGSKTDEPDYTDEDEPIDLNSIPF